MVDDTSPDPLTTVFETGMAAFNAANPDRKEILAVVRLQSADRPSFDTYNGPYASELIEMLHLAWESLHLELPYLSDAAESLIRGTDLAPEIIARRNQSAVFRQFLSTFENASRDPQRLTRAGFDCIVRGWMDQIIAGIHYQSRRPPTTTQRIPDTYNFYLSDADQDSFNNAVRMAEKCFDDKFMSNFINVLIFLHGRNQRFCPFVFLCAPSGSGKTMFGMNIGSYAPSLHWIHTDQPTMQEVYLPFVSYCKVINAAIERDMYFYERRCVPLEVDSFGVFKLEDKLEDTPFESAHLFVTLFERIFQIKASAVPTVTWLQAQMMIQSLQSGKMTLKEGRERLGKLESDIPLSAFIDECGLVRTDDEMEPPVKERRRLQFTRSILRLLKIIPILTGTDARTSDFCGQSNNHSRDHENIWCAVFNDFPCYNYETFIEYCNSVCQASGGCPEVIRLVNFLKAVRVYENPWIINMALEHLMGVEFGDVRNLTSLLDNLLLSLSRNFIERKGMSRYFGVGQCSYVLSHNWDGNVMYTNELSEVCINGHLAKLFGYHFESNAPYFLMRVEANGQKYFGPRSMQTFKPRSYFTPFTLAPLTGLMLFGVDLSKIFNRGQAIDGWNYRHVPFFGLTAESTMERITSFDAVFSFFEAIPKLTIDRLLGRSATGSPTELLYHLAVIIASRCKGVSGSSIPVFLSHFIGEICTHSIRLRGTVQPGHSPAAEYQSFPAQPPTLTIIGGDLLARKSVPLLPPMSVPEWPSAVVELLRGEVGEKGSIHLGVFKHSSKNDPVDSILFESPLPMVLREKSKKLVRIDKEKHYGIGTEAQPFSREPKTKIIVGECKQLSTNVTLGYIRHQIVEQKFEKIRDCYTFIVLAMKTSDFENSTRYSLDDLIYLNSLNYYIWFIAKQSDTAFVMRPIAGQCTHTSKFKDLFIISAAVIWGEEVLRKVMEKWNNMRED